MTTATKRSVAHPSDRDRRLLSLNAVLTLPFGVVALLAPAAVFAPFGLVLDAGGALIARGYAATLLGYGAVYALLRDAAEPKAVRALLVAAVIFNAAEAVIQAIAALSRTAGVAIWGTITAHAVVAVLCSTALFRSRGATADRRIS